LFYSLPVNNQNFYHKKQKNLSIDKLIVPKFSIKMSANLSVIRHQIIDSSRSIIGTPYVHQGRVKGVGVDCIGTVLIVARELNLTNFEISNYGRRSEGVEMYQEFVNQCGRPVDNPLPGDIVMFAQNDWRHCGILAYKGEDLTLIHTHRVVKKCVEHNLDDYWRSLMVAAFRFPSIQ
jgi:cell wall-associated NlpC family hydrolase